MSRGKKWRKKGLAAVACLAVWAVAGCFKNPMSPPQLVAGGEETLTVQSGSWSGARTFAREYCSARGRKAVATGEVPISHDQFIKLYTFDCVDRGR